MGKDKEGITSRQLTVVIISAILGVDGFSMPRMVVEGAGRDGWISLILGGVWILLATLALAVLARSFPGQSPIDWLPKLTGKWPARVFLLLHGLSYLIMCAWALRIFADMTRIYLLPRTPTEVIMITMLLSVVYLIVHGIEPMTRVTQVFFPFTIIPIVLLGVMFRRNFALDEVLPIMADGFLPVIKGIPPAIAVFVGWGLVMYLFQFLDTPKEAAKATGIGIVFLLGFFLWSFIITLSRFGPKEMEFLLFPIIDFAREVESPNALIEKLDLFLLAFWIMTVFLTIAFTYYIPILIVSQSMGFSGIRGLVYTTLPLIFLLARLPKGIKATEKMGTFLGYTSIVFSFIVFLIFLLAWKKRRKEGRLVGKQS